MVDIETPIIPTEIIEIIAKKNVVVYVKLRECCRKLREMLPINAKLRALRFHLKPTLIRDASTGKLTARPAIDYMIAGKYIIKRTRVSNLLYHTAIWFNAYKVMDLRPKQLKYGASEWIYPDTVYYIETAFAVINKYYNREGDGLLCRLIITQYKQSNITKWTIWRDGAYYVMEISASGKIIEDYLESTIREYYPPRIEPDPVWV
ncbi:hypothetical protein D5b_00405 [Faustovirus]|nr:hypothetical protein D5b_00405 [Faustovirus]AMN84510.1 hypothetical protein D6_00100 [Faustovirus]AMP44348.1 hypothetical protein PRJ_Dakar_00396 [Faustovirus]